MPEVTQDDLDELYALVYSRWAAEYDAFKAVKAERNDGSADWQNFHNQRMKNHAASEAKWNAIRLRLSPLHSFAKL